MYNKKSQLYKHNANCPSLVTMLEQKKYLERLSIDYDYYLMCIKFKMFLDHVSLCLDWYS